MWRGKFCKVALNRNKQEVKDMRYCRNCGNALREGQKFCEKCGTGVLFEAKNENITYPKERIRESSKKRGKKRGTFAVTEIAWTVTAVLVLFCVLWLCLSPSKEKREETREKKEQYDSYVEKTHQIMDVDTVERVRGSIETAITNDIDVYNEISAAIDARNGKLVLTFLNSGEYYRFYPREYPMLSRFLREEFGDEIFVTRSECYVGASFEITIYEEGDSLKVAASMQGDGHSFFDVSQ